MSPQQLPHVSHQPPKSSLPFTEGCTTNPSEQDSTEKQVTDPARNPIEELICSVLSTALYITAPESGGSVLPPTCMTDEKDVAPIPIVRPDVALKPQHISNDEEQATFINAMTAVKKRTAGDTTSRYRPPGKRGRRAGHGIGCRHGLGRRGPDWPGVEYRPVESVYYAGAAPSDRSGRGAGGPWQAYAEPGAGGVYPAGGAAVGSDGGRDGPGRDNQCAGGGHRGGWVGDGVMPMHGTKSCFVHGGAGVAEDGASGQAASCQNGLQGGRQGEIGQLSLRGTHGFEQLVVYAPQRGDYGGAG